MRQLAYPDFSADPLWEEVARLPVAKSAIVVVTGLDALLDRCGRREFAEPGRMGTDSYPADRWINHYLGVDLRRHYGLWLEELRRHGIAYTLVDGTTPGFDTVADIEAISVPLEGKQETVIGPPGMNAALPAAASPPS
jgi:hypothetical protein